MKPTYNKGKEPISRRLDEMLTDQGCVPIVYLASDGKYYSPKAEKFLVEAYSGYRNKSGIDDIVTTGDKEDVNLGENGVLGVCYNLSKVIQMNIGELKGNIEQYQVTLRHEIRHRLHGMSDSNPVGNYIMRALDATAMWAKGVYDKVQKYRQK